MFPEQFQSRHRTFSFSGDKVFAQRLKISNYYRIINLRIFKINRIFKRCNDFLYTVIKIFHKNNKKMRLFQKSFFFKCCHTRHKHVFTS